MRRIRSLDERERVFADRQEAGARLAPLLEALGLDDPVLLAIPAGGVPVAVAVARATGWPLDVAVVSKVTLPWNTEAGYGAVAWDGTVRLNDALVRRVGLDEETTREGIARTRTKVERRKRRLRGGEGAPEVAGRTAVLVDDGLASGFTMRVAVEATRREGAARVVVAVPTGHAGAVERLAALADELVCANVRRRTPYAVAAAYERWQDVPEVVADELLRPFRERAGPWATDEC
ncbi:MAG TPA: phosphoribosyltransferase family protein [Sandaracinaceae bacterium LLY-WYZ-13_1]|nr:phosphoribosyltransferase family protein [Sandaracinaceae bacterium LLY-WYZ-13_1]